MTVPGAWDDQLWHALLRGESRVRRLDPATAADWTLDRWPGEWWIAAGEASSRELGLSLEQLAERTARRAAEQAGVESEAPGASRLGLCVGNSKGLLGTRPDRIDLLSGFPGPLTPTHVVDHLAEQFPDRQFPHDQFPHDQFPHHRRSCPVAACATGLVSMIEAARWIRWNECDRVLAGAADASINPAVLASYRRLGVLSKGCPTPFGRDRDGFVIGEGAGLLIAEAEEHAAWRGAQPIARWLGDDIRSDASGLVQADESGEAIAVAVGNALAMAGLQPREIDAISLHGTGTGQNDRAEGRGLRRVFGPHLNALFGPIVLAGAGAVQADRAEGRGLRRVFGPHLNAIPAFSVKGAWGHALGAASALELVVCVRMLRDQIVPPHVMHGPIDPDCQLTNLQSVAQSRPVRHVLKVALGFGGHVAAGVLGRV